MLSGILGPGLDTTRAGCVIKDAYPSVSRFYPLSQLTVSHDRHDLVICDVLITSDYFKVVSRHYITRAKCYCWPAGRKAQYPTVNELERDCAGFGFEFAYITHVESF